MYRGFNVELSGDSFYAYKKHGLKIYDIYKTVVNSRLESFLRENGSLDATRMQANWFPEIEADVFISHSHRDVDLAISFSGWLAANFGLVAFVDSCVWGYADDLLRIIDDRYCVNDNGKTYNYTRRNYSTSHVHMMLSTALSMMMDNTECICFLNTPNSITSADVIMTEASTWVIFRNCHDKDTQTKEQEGSQGQFHSEGSQ